MTRSQLHHVVLGACLLIIACGESGANGAAGSDEPSVAGGAGAGAEATPASAGKADGGPVSGMSAARAGTGPDSADASVSDADSASGAGAGGASPSSDADAGGMRDGAVAGAGGVSGAAGESRSEAAGVSGSAAAGASGAGAGGSDAGMPGETVTLTGQVIEAQSNGNFTPYPNAEVCVLDSAPPVCATADADGMLVIDLPANSRTGLTMDVPGLFPMMTPITTGTTDIDLSSRGGWSNYGAAVVIAEGARNSATSMLGTMFDPNKGQADMIALSIGSGTVTLEGTPAELKWFMSGGQFTVTDGAAPFGSVLHGFTNIEPGMRTFRAEANGQPCAFDPMIWAGDQPGTVTVPIRAGWWTRLMEVRCD